MMTEAEYPERLLKLKKNEILQQKVFDILPENMHYEIFEYLAQKDLLRLRGVNLGAFQLTTNPKLRSRYQKYIHMKAENKNIINMLENNNLFVIERKARIKYFIEQIFGPTIYCRGIQIPALTFKILGDVIPHISPQLDQLLLCTMFIYNLYLDDNKMNLEHFSYIFENNLEFLGNLHHLTISN